MTDEFVKLLDQGYADLGIELSDQQKEQFFKYYEMLIEKNKVMNLTAITELSDVITKHFVDSLLLVLAAPELGLKLDESAEYIFREPEQDFWIWAAAQDFREFR